MVFVELRESAYNKAFDLIEDAKIGQKKTKLALCELEECLANCFEQMEDGPDNINSTIDNVEIGELNYRRGMRGAMRHSMHDDDMYSNPEMRMRMRRRLSRYSY
jgi:hypothetical protein